jgi:carboxylesterase type B
MSEDCLYLNVWTSANRANAKLPLMFWIYVGGYTEGAGSSPFYAWRYFSAYESIEDAEVDGRLNAISARNCDT